MLWSEARLYQIAFFFLSSQLEGMHENLVLSLLCKYATGILGGMSTSYFDDNFALDVSFNILATRRTSCWWYFYNPGLVETISNPITWSGGPVGRALQLLLNLLTLCWLPHRQALLGFAWKNVSCFTGHSVFSRVVIELKRFCRPCHNRAWHGKNYWMFISARLESEEKKNKMND